MMKSYIKGIMIISCIVILAACGGKDGGSSAGGGAEKSKENPITAGKTGIYELEGTVGRSNTISNTFILEMKEGDVEVQVRAMSKMLVNGERTPLSAIKPGSHMKGTFKKWDGQDAVMEVVVTN